MYLDICYDIIVEELTHKMQPLTFIRLCTSHVTKNMKNDVFKCFKKKDEFFTICSMIGIVFDLKSFKEIDDYLKDFLTLLMIDKKTSQIEIIRKKIVDRVDGDFQLPQNDFDMDVQKEFLECETIFKNSKFFQIYDNFIKNIEDVDIKNATEKNPLFNPKFAAIFLKKYVAYLPFWSSILSTLRCDYQKHANNGLIEGKT